MKKLVVAGGGILGSQIAFQSAFCGFDVTVWLRSEASIARTQPKLDALRQSYLDAIALMAGPMASDNWCRGIADAGQPFNKEECIAKVERAYASIKIELDMKAAMSDAELLMESITENEADKIAFYKKVAPFLPEKTIIVTNASTILPSALAESTGRPEKFMSLHFSNAIWKNNVAEVMVQPLAKDSVFEAVFAFANDIRMVALPVMKEKKGYLINSMLIPFLLSGLDLYANGISDPKSIDKAWTLGTGSPRGPFQIFDAVGIKTAYDIVLQFQKVPGLLSPVLKKMLMPYNFKAMEKILKKMIDDGKLGKSSGEGFYKYGV